jgi:alpha-galactosidase
MKNTFKIALCLAITSFISISMAQTVKKEILAPTPPMGWMTWNYYGVNINEKNIRDIADAMVETGMVKAGYKFIMIDDGWQGGRDNRNRMIPDVAKFPGGIKVLADYVHQKGIKLGIYSDAAQLTCAGYTASLGFENEDAKTFASWEIDYLKYDYCNAPEDSVTAKTRYKKMSDALNKCGRNIVFSICEWGDREPWHWAGAAGGQLWRTTADIRDRWIGDAKRKYFGIMDAFDTNSTLSAYASPGKWNDPDMLVVGLYGKKGPASNANNKGCTDVEYQSQMSLWSMMSSPLITSCNLADMNAATKRILLNPDVIAIDQDALGQQAIMKSKDATWNILVKNLANGDIAIAILNRSETTQNFTTTLNQLGLPKQYRVKDVWNNTVLAKAKTLKGTALSHETKLFRLTPMK